MTDQTTPRPAGLDALLGHVAANLPGDDAATAEAAAQLAPLAAAIRDERARHDAEVSAGALRAAADRLLAHPGPHTDTLHADAPGFWWDTRDRDAAAVLLLQLADEISAPAKPAAVDTLPAWLYQRFGRATSGVDWTELYEMDTSYWEHEAAAVRRAVARGGFKNTTAGGEQA